MDNLHHSFNYIELPATDLNVMKAFYAAALGWTYEDWGETYAAIKGAGLEGGLNANSAQEGVEPGQETKQAPQCEQAGPLVILYSNDLIASQAAVIKAGGIISVPVFEFPGGRRFHFKDPSGNELAIWSPIDNHD